MTDTSETPIQSAKNESKDQETSSPFNNTTQIPQVTAPKGGGAISGIGEKFQANPVTGTGSMSVPVSISPGRNGFSPELALQYDSGNGNGIFGAGWNVGIPSITRKTQKGLPLYKDSEESDLFILSGAEDLVPALKEENGSWIPIEYEENGYFIKRFRPRTEGSFSKIEKFTKLATGICYWQVVTKDNITSIYGKDVSARVSHPDHDNQTFQWLLQYTHDEKGNIIWYEYKQENNQGLDSGLLSEKNRIATGNAFNRVYPKFIRYSSDLPFSPLDANFFTNAKWHFQIAFDYGEHINNSISEDSNWEVRMDPFSDYRAGFEQRTYRLCKRILLFHFFESDLGGIPYLTKSTSLEYDENPVLSTVKTIEQIRHQSGESPESLPPVSFEYSKVQIDRTIHEYNEQDTENLPVGSDGQRYRWADLHGEGLQGILIEDANAWYFKKNLGDENYYKELAPNAETNPEARLGHVQQIAERPSLANLLANNQQLSDLDSNGQIDLVLKGERISGFYERNENSDWENFVAFEQNPNINWNDPNLRSIDIDGDGYADLLLTEDQCFTYYRSLGKEGFEAAQKTFRSLDEEKGPNIVFSDGTESIYLADMSGDGMTDLVRIVNGSVCYWPNLGYGRFGNKVSMDNSPWFDSEDQFDQKRIRLGDIDGSGTTDILYLSGKGVCYYPNQSGNRFGNEITIHKGLPTHQLINITTLDILGNGTQCLVWSSPVEGDMPPSIKYIDLMGRSKPYLLVETNNNMGSLTRLKYAPSTKFYLRDERAGTPWITKLPFPVQVVEQIELFDEINQNRFVTKYAYHHGYFDGVEREFRGFGMVEQWDTETLSDFDGGLFPQGVNEEVINVPPIHTKTWFHTGFYKAGDKVLSQYQKEYWQEDSEAFELDGSVDQYTTFSENREAARALKGSLLRQEVYSKDGASNENIPYTVSESTYSVRQIQPRDDRDRRDKDFGVYLTIPKETLSYHYERNADDPRISHQLTLETDFYGHPLKTAAVVYGRRSGQSIGHEQQDQPLITVTSSSVINEDNNANFYRLGVPSEVKKFQLELELFDGQTLLTPTSILNEFDSATAINFEPNPTQEAIGYLDFNGTNNYVAVRNINYNTANSLSSFTAEAWVRTDFSGSSYNSNWAIIDFDRSEYFNFYIRGNNGKVGFSTAGAGTSIHDMTGSQVVNDGQWHHLAIVYDGTDKIIYVDGQEDSRALNPHGGLGLGKSNTRYAIIGDGSEASTFDGGRNNKYFEGQLTEIRYWESVRTPQEISDFKNVRLAGNEGGLVLYYDMTEATGVLLTDRTGNGNDGEMRNMTTSWRTHGPVFQLTPTPVSGTTKRPLEQSRIVYYDEVLTEGTPLPLGQVASHALPYKTYQMALTPGLVSHTLNDLALRVDTALLVEGGYIDLDSNGYYWIPSGRSRFDKDHFFLPIAQEDPFGNESTIIYDSYHLLPIQITDALSNNTLATYDYRILQPEAITDPNGNRQAFAFDVLGMVSKIAIMGKTGDSDGDTLADPTAEFTYDLFRWKNEQKPNMAYSKTREKHQDISTRYQESYAYSNGLGQVVMTKTKVAPGDAYSRNGNGDLLRDGNDDLILAAADPRWVGSGRTILDNKGNPVKQYEPYFSSTHEYESEVELVEYGVTPVIHYDPLGRAIRTELPDNTLTRVEFTPWEQKKYDQNDTVLDSLWYVERNSPDPLGTEPTDANERAAWLTAQHANTPQVIHLDALGRPFVTIDDNATDGQYTMTTALDIQGNPLNITDAKDRKAFTYHYDMLGQTLKTTHIDNGMRYAANNVLGHPLRTWDNRGHQIRYAYDELRRPTHSYLTPDYDSTPGAEQLIALTVYGESENTPQNNNLRGQVYLVFDSAGLVKNTAFDFKGNLLSSERQLANTYQTSPDWLTLDGFTDISTLLSDAASLLESETFQTTNTYDALNRPVSMTQPDNSEILPLYNEAGQLEAVDTKLRGASMATGFVSNIEYNARGQRDKILYTNNVLTNYTYDERTFRLTRLLTTRNSGVDILQDLNYTFDPVGNIVEQVDSAQETHFFSNAQVSPNGKYTYDALYRLLSSSGRELVGIGTPGAADITAQNSIPDTNASALRGFTQSYEYDELGNIEKMIHTATGGSWTRHYHYNSGFTTNQLLSTSPDDIQPTTDEYTYDAHGNMTSMPHLATIGWDYADRMQSADLGGGGNAYYTYDAGGNRVRKVIDKGGGLIHERIYLGDWEVYRESQSGTVQLERETLHISDDTGRIALADTLTIDSGSPVGSPTTTIRYQHSNHLGSAALELDDTGAIISYEEYHPFGSTAYRSGRSAAEVSIKRYRYVGKERDDETGLYYYGARYYAAWLARFVSVDPLKDDYPQLNPFNYGSNNPVTSLDLEGLQNPDEEVRTRGIVQSKDATDIIGVSDRAKQIEFAQKRQNGLDQNASNVISKLTGSSVEEIGNQAKSSGYLPLTDLLKGKALDKVREGAVQGTESLQQAELEKLNKQGIVSTNTGENFKVSRRDKLGNPRNIGFIRQGELVTSRGTVTSNGTSRVLGKAAGGLKLFKSLFDGPGPLAPSILDLAQVLAGQVEPESILPLSFVAEDQFNQIETELLNTAIQEGFETTFDIINNSPNFNKDLEFIFVSEEDAFDILSDRVNSLDKLQGAKENQLFDPEGGNFAILISRSRSKIEVNSIFYSEDGFKTN